MTHRDMLQDFALILRAFKAQHDLSTVPRLFPLNSQLSPTLYTWFCAYFLKKRHKDWLEHVCHMPLQRTSHHIRHLQITDESFINLVDTALLTGLDDFYSHRPAVSASASVPAAIASAAPSVIDVGPPLISNQPAVAVAACASQPVTNLAMLSHFGEQFLAFKEQRKWTSTKESVSLAMNAASQEEQGKTRSTTSAEKVQPIQLLFEFVEQQAANRLAQARSRSSRSKAEKVA